MEAILRRLSKAVSALSKIKDGKTLFEGSPTKDQECFDAWKELNDAQKQAKLALKILSDPDDEPHAGPELSPRTR